MKVKEIMSQKKIVFMDPNKTIVDAAKPMKDENIGLVLVGSKDNIEGVVTDRDLVIKGLAKGDPKTQLKDIMTKGAKTCKETDDVEKVVETMGKNQIHRLVVVNDQDKPVTVLSFGDIARGLEDEKVAGKTIKAIRAK